MYNLFFKTCRFVLILRDFSWPTNFRFSISPGKFRLFFLFRVEFWNQFTEELCIFMNHHSLWVFIMASYSWVVFILIVRLSSHWVIVIIAISGVFLNVIGTNIVWLKLLSEKSICCWFSYLASYKFYWALTSIVVI